MTPSVSVGAVSTAGVGSVEDGTDVYTTSLAQATDLSNGDPCCFIKVGRGLQPLGFAGFHVSPNPDNG